jgi:hypothetical protein
MVLKSRECEFSDINIKIEQLEKFAKVQKGKEIVEMLQNIVPEYLPPFFEHKN